MTNETAELILISLQSSYPSEAYKLNGAIKAGFMNMLLTGFRNTDDDVVVHAVANCCKESETLPSIAMIHKAVKALQNKVNEYEPLPEIDYSIQSEKVLEVIRNAKKRREERRKNGKQQMNVDPNDAEYYSFLSLELVQYARKRMPDITLERIYENSLEIQYNMECGGMCDGHPMGLVVDKLTGLISNHVFIRGGA